MTLLQRIHYIWVRAGATLLVAMPFVMWATFRPWGVDGAVMTASATVAVSDEDDAIVFGPSQAKTTALMLLPGCPVDPLAYAPLARSLADSGHLTAIVRLPYRCAPLPGHERTLDQRIAALAAKWPEATWILVGHSRGAGHTARIAAGRSPFAGFVLMGTSHPREIDLSALPIRMTKIVATKDGVAGTAQFETRRLPASTTWIRIEGGNHSQFGYYGFQLFDHRAAISRAEQQAQVFQALLTALRLVEPQSR